MPDKRTERFRQAGDVLRRKVGATTYLLHPSSNTIHELNATGAAIWDQLAEPLSDAELVKLLVSAFPDTRPARIRKDLGALLDELVAAGLASRCD
jgi:hypothetical protein